MELVVGEKFGAFVPKPEDVRQVMVCVSQGVRLFMEMLEETTLGRPEL